MEFVSHPLHRVRSFERLGTHTLRVEFEDGSLVLPGGVSISRSLVEDWYGGPLPGQW